MTENGSNKVRPEPGSASKVLTDGRSVKPPGEGPAPGASLGESQPPGEGAPRRCGRNVSVEGPAEDTPQQAPGDGGALDTHADHSSSKRRSRYQSGRKRRYELRRTLWQITKHRRCAHCGRSRVDSDKPYRVKVRQGEDGPVAGLDNIQTCGSPWACPVCAAKTRQERAEEIARVASRHLEDGGGLLYWTGTLRHHQGQSLSELWDAMKDGWSRGVINGSSWVRDREKYGIIDYVQSPDVTVGPNGWHPHLPVLLFAEEPLSDDDREELGDRMFSRWARAVERSGLDRPLRMNCPLEAARSDEAVSRYLSRAVLKDGGVDVGFELQRHDRKRASDRPGGKRGHMTPFELLGELHQWPEDRRPDGEPSELLKLWWEYEEATSDRKSIHWSGDVNGLRGEVQAEIEAEEEEEDDGDLVAEIGPPAYQAMASEPGGLAGLLECAEGLREESIGSYIRRFRRKAWEKSRKSRVVARRTGYP